MTYDPVTYWRERGKVYQRDFRPAQYRAQEAALRGVLRSFTFDSVLDVGCGFGRIGELVYAINPNVRYLGVDLSPDQLDAARHRLPLSARFAVVDARQLDLMTKYDLVVASEVLMHVPPDDVAGVAMRLRRIGRHVVTVDWEAPGKRAGLYCFGHDYEELLPGADVIAVGRQAIRHWQS